HIRFWQFNRTSKLAAPAIRGRQERGEEALPFRHPATDSMVRASDSEPSMRLFILPLVVLPGLVLLLGCTSDSGSPAQPSFYTSMADEGTTLDSGAAASMISGYRHNSGLGPVEVDPDLMRIAMDHARTM